MTEFVKRKTILNRIDRIEKDIRSCKLRIKREQSRLNKLDDRLFKAHRDLTLFDDKYDTNSL